MCSSYFRYSGERAELENFVVELGKLSVKCSAKKCAPDHLIARAQYSSLIGSWICIVMNSSRRVMVFNNGNKKYSLLKFVLVMV